MRIHYHAHRIETTAPIVPDVVLEHLGDAFLSHGGSESLGEFEAFVRTYRCATSPRAHARAMQRRSIDRRTNGG